MIKRVYFQNHKSLNFDFFQNENDFIVEEMPIEFTLKGNFLILKIKKVNLGTWDLIDLISNFLRIDKNEVGYAGLKDKNATTTQYISIPKRYSKDIKKFKHKKVQILETYLHKEKLNIGDLKGNRFKINLKKVDFDTLILIQNCIKNIKKTGMANYFGFQRFGRDIEENIEKAKQLVSGNLHIKDRKLEKMLISAYQSAFFNSWLVKRISLQKDKFKLIDGDVFHDLKKDKFFTSSKITSTLEENFDKKVVCPTGLLPGRKVFKATLKSREIEERFDDSSIYEKGYRRDALVFVKINDIKYNKATQECLIDFILPKGSYATVFIENIANKNFNS
ncbi:tRNA pseudouridine(13) synthase TruD [Malaciobacter halophilus]|nr:tRNA pseudouridine(13) synthase TruD [Malaciobacter halophilus]RYA24019.1 tRNA pseudouridine(13) synthase TruD [Malaciobacter halophilus]